MEEAAPLPKTKARAQEKMFSKPLKPIPPRRALPATPQAPLAVGKLEALDGANAGRLRRGEIPIEATLDLHGMTYANAEAALRRFLSSHYVRGSRCLLIITGKGTKGEGILKQSLPGWLASDDLRPMLLAVTPARPKHGGSGAFYILLKRKR